MLYCGIDPGFSGAIVFWNDKDESLRVYHMPVLKDPKTGKTSLNIPEIIRIMKQSEYIQVGLELVHSMPKQGVAGVFNFGLGYGIIQGILSTLQIPYILITPQKWMKNVPEKSMGKAGVVKAAMALYPHLQINLKKEYPFADAVMIMHYARCQMNYIDKAVDKGV